MSEENINNVEKIKNFIEELHTDYELWYAHVVRINYRFWYALQLLTLLSGFFSSIYIAFQTETTWTPTVRIIGICLPIFGSLGAAVILQFKVFETWRLREEGRIAFQNLYNFANSEFIKCSNNTEYQNLFNSLVAKTNEIENDQANKFFALYGSNLIMKFNKS